MKIFELFDTKKHIIPDEDNRRALIQSAKIGDNTITFHAHRDDDDQWEISFLADDGDSSTFNLTGQGHAAETMAFIVQSVKDLIEKRDPQTMWFSVEKDEAEQSRTKLYLRIVKRLMKDIHGYELKPPERGNYETGYVLQRIGT